MINCKLSCPNVLQFPYVGMEIPVIIYVLLSMTSVLGLSLIFIIVMCLSHFFIIVMHSWSHLQAVSGCRPHNRSCFSFKPSTMPIVMPGFAFINGLCYQLHLPIKIPKMQDQKHEVQRNTVWPWPGQAKAWIVDSMQCMRATWPLPHSAKSCDISHTPDRAVMMTPAATQLRTTQQENNAT